MLTGDCNVCINNKLPSYSATCVECGLSRKNYKPITNADRLRAMTDEELAAWLSHHSMACVQGKRPCPEDCVGGCEQCWLDWLKQEAGE